MLTISHQEFLKFRKIGLPLGLFRFETDFRGIHKRGNTINRLAMHLDGEKLLNPVTPVHLGTVFETPIENFIFPTYFPN